MSALCPYIDGGLVVMSNCEHTIDKTIEAELKEKEEYGCYAGWNFFGYVWWKRDVQRWACDVWQYHKSVEVVEAETLEEIMQLVCDKYGSE